MRLSEERLIGWLVVLAFQDAEDGEIVLPESVRRGWLARGWVVVEREGLSMTPVARDVVIENAASWGVLAEDCA